MSASAFAQWFRANQRDLPWRADARDPYRVVVSEFMLQQTQVERVVPRFLAFVERFPSFESLAEASVDEVLAMWSGLGYYRRARQLHELARQVAAMAHGVPRTREELLELPGIGPYTASAIASLAFGTSDVVLDGNVYRVGARVLGLRGNPRDGENQECIQEWVHELMSEVEAPVVNEGLMELGALICTPRAPRCGACPFAGVCQALDQDLVEEIPPSRRRRGTVEVSWAVGCWIDDQGRWLLRRVENWPVLEGLWLPPLVEIPCASEAVSAVRALGPWPKEARFRTGKPVQHSITHRRITVHPVVIEAATTLIQGEEWRWVDPGRGELATSSLLEKLVRTIHGLS